MKYRWLNTLGLVLVLVVNFLANSVPINGITTGALSDMYPNYFVPAGFTFSIWGVIYLFVISFIVVQWVRKDQEKSINAIGPWFFLSCLANASWIFAWHYLQIELSLLLMLAIFFCLVQIYQRLQIGSSPSESAIERWFMKAPFSIYLGWISVATIANVTTLLVHYDWQGGFLAPASWAAIMIIIAAVLGLLILIYRADLLYALVLIWALWGIYSKRTALDDLPQSMFFALAVGGGLLLIYSVIKLRNWKQTS